MARSSKGRSGAEETSGAAITTIQDNLVRTRIAPDLLAEMNGGGLTSTGRTVAAKPPMYDVIIEFNRSFPGGINTARLTLLSAYANVRAAEIPEESRALLASGKSRHDDALVEAFGEQDEVAVGKSMLTDNYVFATLSVAAITNISRWTLRVSIGRAAAGQPDEGIPLIYKIWRDHPISRCVYESVRTIKCDAARITFAADGKGIVWAVADTGIDATHPHFRLHSTLQLDDGLLHKDFTQEHISDQESEEAALTDADGHGTHVAGIIAGFTCRTQDQFPGVASHVTKITVRSQARNGSIATPVDVEYSAPISGLAPYCKLVSVKVLTSSKSGKLSNLLAAIGYIQKCNDNGRSLKIHGLNLSLGYPFDPEWFAAGQSPLCVEVDRLVRSGVCVVVAAGNGGYGVVSTYSGPGERAAHMSTIADPGNANLAITVGSTHRNMPHAYGISYFSAKGPTSDGRMKPDLVAPGERIVSCAVMNDASGQATEALFREDSGTSMAAPHVSGAIAGFLSVRSEFKGRPEQVKDIFVQAATDLKRRPEFQGTGLIDLLRALQSV
jgi:subtilisin family serine protease